MARTRTKRSPALAASILGHAALVAAALIVLPHHVKHLKLGESVPITIVASGPAAELAPALKAPEPSPPTTPEPVPEAPTPPAPQPAPTPKVAPAPPPKPNRAPTSSKPTPPQKPAPAKPAEPDFFNSLTATIASAAKATGQQGPAHPRTGPVAQTGKGADDHMSASELGALREKLYKLWNPNCGVEGASRVKVKVRIRLTPDGRLAAPAEDVDNLRSSGNPVVAAAAERAVSAVGRGAPYTELNPEHYEAWRDLVLNFDGAKACANR